MLLFLALSFISSEVGQLDSSSDPAVRSPRYSVAGIRSGVGGDDKVGRKTAGFLCAPAGVLKWRDVSPDPFLASAAVASALRSAGVDVAGASEDDLDGASPGPFRVIGSIVAVHVDACVPEHGFLKALGGRQSLNATGWVKVRWRVVKTATGAVMLDSISERPFNVKSKTLTLPDVVVSALQESAAQLAVGLAKAN